MKKDLIIAIIVGFCIGALVAIIVLNLPIIFSKNLKPKEEKTAKIIQEVSPTISEIIMPKQVLEINFPQDNSIIKDQKLNLTGKTSNNSVIVLETASDSQIKESSNDGTFQIDTKLSEGKNDIHVTSFDVNGTSITKKIMVYYTQEKL